LQIRIAQAQSSENSPRQGTGGSNILQSLKKLKNGGGVLLRRDKNDPVAKEKQTAKDTSKKKQGPTKVQRPGRKPFA